jgi:hypothetical protein
MLFGSQKDHLERLSAAASGKIEENRTAIMKEELAYIGKFIEEQCVGDTSSLDLRLW